MSNKSLKNPMVSAWSSAPEGYTMGGAREFTSEALWRYVSGCRRYRARSLDYDMQGE